MKLYISFLAAGVMAIGSYCNASVIVYSDLNESTPTVTIDGVDINMSARASNIVFSGELVSFDLSLPNSNFLSLSAFTNLLDPANSDDPLNTVSDRLVFSFTNGALTYHVSVGSDPDLPAIPVGAADLTTVPQQGLPANPYYEDGTAQLVATAFMGSSNDTFFIQSDVGSVPEPGTVTLVLSGLGAAVFSGRRRRFTS